MQKLGTVIYFSYFIPSLCFIPSPSDCPQSMFYTDAKQSKLLRTSDLKACTVFMLVFG